MIPKKRDPRFTPYRRFHCIARARALAVGRSLVAEEIVSIFQEALADLRTIEDPSFYDLGKIAREQSTDTRQQIAMAVCDQILKVPADLKLTLLHFLDLLVMNVDKSFGGLFEPRLPEIFVDTYKKADASVRVDLVKLFKTWQKYFPLSVLQKIEDELPLKLQEIPKAECSDNLRHTASQSALLLHGVRNNLENKDNLNQPENSRSDGQCAMVPSSSRSFRKTSSFPEGSSSVHHLKLLSPFGGSGSTETSSVIQAEGALLASRTASPRIRLKRPISPLLENPPLSGYVAGKSGDWNGEITTSRPFGDVAHNHPNEDHQTHATNNSHEKLLKLQKPDYEGSGQGTTSRFMHDILEECGYEVMSPTLSSQNKGSGYNLTPYPDTGLSQLNASRLGKELWSGRPSPSQFDHPFNSNSGHVSLKGKCHDDVGSHTEGLRRNKNSFHDQYISNHVEAQGSINAPNFPQLVSGRTLVPPLVHPRHSLLPPSPPQPLLTHGVALLSRPPPPPPHLVQPHRHYPHNPPPLHSTVMSWLPPQSSQFTFPNSINNSLGSSPQISPGPPSAYLQRRSASQVTNTFKSESILSMYPELFHSLIDNGFITLNTQASSQGTR